MRDLIWQCLTYFPMSSSGTWWIPLRVCFPVPCRDSKVCSACAMICFSHTCGDCWGKTGTLGCIAWRKCVCGALEDSSCHQATQQSRWISCESCKYSYIILKSWQPMGNCKLAKVVLCPCCVIVLHQTCSHRFHVDLWCFGWKVLSTPHSIIGIVMLITTRYLP